MNKNKTLNVGSGMASIIVWEKDDIYVSEMSPKSQFIVLKDSNFDYQTVLADPSLILLTQN